MRKKSLLWLLPVLAFLSIPLQAKADEQPSYDKKQAQLVATMDNLNQTLQTIKDTKDTNKINSLKVQVLNIESQIHAIESQKEKDAAHIKEAKEKAEREAKEKAEKEAREKAEKEAKEKAEREAAERIAKTQEEQQATNTETGASKAPNVETTDDRKKLIEYGKSLLGIPYVWGGTDPNSGLDCSGFTSNVYSHVLGINTGRTTWDQDREGKHIDLSELKPGDLILENNKEHIAMYLGDGMQIEAPQPGDVVSIHPVPSSAMYGLRFID